LQALLDPTKSPSCFTRYRAIATASGSVTLRPKSFNVLKSLPGNYAPEGVVDDGQRELDVLREPVDPSA
jgi:hypothetical protein